MYTKPILGQQINWAHPLAKGLVGCWVLNEGSGDRIYDLSGNSIDLTKVGPDWEADYLDFISANSDYLFTSNDVLNIGGKELTVAALIKSDSVTGERAIVSRYEYDANLRQYYLLTDGSTIQFRVGTGGSASQAASGAGTLSIGEWHWIIGTYNGVAVKVYLDDVEKGSINSSITIGQFTQDTGIGRLMNTPVTAFFDGQIRCIYIYKRAFTPQNIQQLTQEPYAMFTRDEIELDYEYLVETYNTLFFGMNF